MLVPTTAETGTTSTRTYPSKLQKMSEYLNGYFVRNLDMLSTTINFAVP